MNYVTWTFSIKISEMTVFVEPWAVRFAVFVIEAKIVINHSPVVILQIFSESLTVLIKIMFPDLINLTLERDLSGVKRALNALLCDLHAWYLTKNSRKLISVLCSKKDIFIPEASTGFFIKVIKIRGVGFLVEHITISLTFYMFNPKSGHAVINDMLESDTKRRCQQNG